MIKQIAKQFIKNSIKIKVSGFAVGIAITTIFMYRYSHYPIYKILIGDMIALLICFFWILSDICFLQILINTISQVVLKSKKNN